MSERRLRSGKILESEQSKKQIYPKEKVVNESKSVNMAAAAADLLQELKSMRAELKGHITKLSDELKDFQRNTNERLSKIESIMSKVDEIDGIKSKQQELEGDVESIKESLNFVNINTEEVENLRKSNEELKKKVEHLERYSRDFNIRILGVNETQGEDCLAITMDFISSLGFEDAAAKVENAHRMGKKRDNKPRHIIAKLYSRPFKKKVIQVSKSEDGKATLGGARIVEDFSPGDFETRKKALPLMKKVIQVSKSEDGKATLGGARIVEDFSPGDFETRKKALPLMKKAYDEGKRLDLPEGNFG